MGKGDIRVDKTFIQGNATLFNGATVETGNAVSDLMLSSGAEYKLGPQSLARIYEDKVVLKQGTAEVLRTTNNGLTVGDVSIRSSERRGRLRVTSNSPGLVQVAALRGRAELYASSGQLLATIPSGLGLAFDPQAAGAAPPMKLHGVVSGKNGKYFITDCQTGESMELTGEEASQWVGKTVEVSGSVASGSTGNIYRGAWFAASDKPCRVPSQRSGNKSGESSPSVLASKTTWIIVGSAGAAAAAAGFVASGSDNTSVSR